MGGRNNDWIRNLIVGTLLVLLGVSGARAQVDRAALTGTILDASGASVPGAKVEAVAVDTRLNYHAMSNSEGVYRFTSLPVGNYTITVSREGFKTLTIKNVDLHVGETRTLDVGLAVGSVTEKVEVTEALSPIERSSAESGDVIRSEQLENLPVNGRDWNTLEMLAPWAQDDGGGDMRTIRFAGRARDDNVFTFDGVDATGIQEQAQKSSVRLQVSEDAIAEFRVSSALYTAEYGSQAGGQVNVVTKSGTDVFHGTAFGYLRNSAVDARAFLDPAQIPPFRMGQYGMTLGGPIKKEKTFFFLSYEGVRQLQGTTMLAAVPDPALQNQILNTSPAMCTILQAWPWRQSAGTIGTCAPKFVFPDAQFTDTGSGGNNVDNFVHERDTILHEDSWLVRVDHKFSDKTSFYGRAQRDISLSRAPLGAALDEQAVYNHPANYLLALVHAFSPNLVNEAKLGVNRSPFHNPQLCVMPLNAGQVCPEIDTTNFETLNNSNTDNEVGTTMSFIDNLTMTHGRQTYKMGIEIRRVRLNQGITFNNRIDFFDGGDNTSLINNQITDVQYFGNWCCRGLRRTFFMPFFQDEWKLTPTFTVNLGVRWEYYGVAHEAHNRTVVFDLQQFKGVCVGSGETRPEIRVLESTAVNCPTNPSLYPGNYRNWDPRVSFAWAPPTFHDKTVIRSGFGIYHGAAQNDDLNAGLESDNTRVLVTSGSTATPQQLAFDSGYLNGSPTNFDTTTTPVPGTSSPAPRALFRQGRRDLYVEQWGLTIDQALPGDLLFSTSYLGSHGVRLFARSLENTCDPTTYLSTGVCVRPLNALPPGGNPSLAFAEVDFKQDVGTSSYHGLLVSLQRRMTSGLSFQTRYTFSHSINDGSVGGGESNTPENVLCRSCDRGPSVYDIRHNFVVNSIYDLPFGPGKTHLNASGFLGKLAGGWSLSGLANWHTGHPLTVLFSPDPTQLPDQNTRSDERPDLVPGVSLTPPGGANPALWINPAAFTTPPSELNPIQDPSCAPTCIIYTRYGNSGRGLVRAPSTWAIDMSIAKLTKLTERVEMQLRLDVFNIFNHTQFGDPSSLDFQAGDFGLISTTANFNNNNDNIGATNTGTGLPRQLQLSLRITF
jgi:hypothetical protein